MLLGFLIFAACAGKPASAAGDVAGAFDSANKLYEQGKYSDAATAYQKLLKSDSASTAVYFNLGNALFKSGDLGRALAAYRQAEQIAPRDPDVRANIQYVRKQIQGPTFETGWLQNGLARLTSNEWCVIASAALWIWFCLLALTQFRPDWKQSLRTLIWLSGLATLGVSACLGVQLYLTSTKIAIVTSDDAVVRNGPLDEAQSAFTVHDGAELQVLDTKDDWLQVTTDNRRIGWVKRAQVTIIPPPGTRPG